MTRSLRVLTFGALGALATLAACGDDDPQAALPDAAPLPAVGLTVLEVERAVDLTPDGRTALLWTQSNGDLIFYDTVTGLETVKTRLDDAESLQTQQPFGLSQTLRIAATYGYPPEEAGLWDAAHDWVTLGSPLAGCTDDTMVPPRLERRGGAFDVSDDGHVAVGLLWSSCNDTQAFLWSEASGTGVFTLLDLLGTSATIHAERASVVSADGQVAGGFAPKQSGEFEIDRSPALWHADGSGILLDPGANGAPGEVTALSADGTIAAGILAGALGGQTGFVWSQATGLETFSTETPDVDTIFVNAMTDDGRVTFGQLDHPTDPNDPAFSPHERSAFARTKAAGLVKLQELATAHGIAVPDGLTLINVQAVSADGTVILGDAELPADPATGFAPPRLYVLVLPPGAIEL
jgi:hypothetical protein